MSIDTSYGRTLVAVGSAPIKTSDRYRAIAEESEMTAITVPITDLISQRPRRLRKQTRNITKKKFAHSSARDCCPTPVDKFEEFEESEIITFYSHEEPSAEDAAAGEIQYPYDILLRGIAWYPAASRSSRSGAIHRDMD